jgi:formate hydrogenlyase subunit 4
VSVQSLLALVALAIAALAECARLPVDNPSTHLELTMIHEAMVLDHAGPAFAFIQYGAALKLTVFASLLVTLLSPAHAGGVAVDLALFLGALAGTGVLVGLVESSMARLRLARVPQLLVTATLLAGFAVVLLVR